LRHDADEKIAQFFSAPPLNKVKERGQAAAPVRWLKEVETNSVTRPG